jgi:hypothetical protein
MVDVVNIIAESLSQHDEKRVVPTKWDKGKKTKLKLKIITPPGSILSAICKWNTARKIFNRFCPQVSDQLMKQRHSITGMYIEFIKLCFDKNIFRYNQAD